MKNLIYLKDYKDEVLEECIKRNGTLSSYFSPAELKQAFEVEVKKELKYNIKKGKTYNNEFGLISEYVDNKDISIYESEQEAAQWAFAGYVRNSASMIKNGYLKP